MYELPKPKVLKVFDMIVSSRDKILEIEQEESKLGATYLAWTNLFQRAINTHERDCEEFPDSPMAKIFKKDKARLKIYPTDEVVTSEFHGLTYSQGKAQIEDIQRKRKDLEKQKDKFILSVKRLKVYYDRIKALDDVYVSKDVVAASINLEDLNGAVKSNWKTLKDSLAETPELLHDLHEQRFSICMVMETSELYPLQYRKKEKYQGCRKVYQQQYFYFVDPDSPSGSGYWYLDPTGVGNHEEFIIIDNTRQYQMIHTSEHEYLNTMFNWYGLHLSELQD